MPDFRFGAGGFSGLLAERFAVDAIPATFSIDADGVLEDQHVGDESIDGELKKMIAHAVELANRKPAPASSQTVGTTLIAAIRFELRVRKSEAEKAITH